MITRNTEITKSDLNRRDKDIYDLVDQLIYGKISLFTSNNDMRTEHFSWSIHYDKGKKSGTVCGVSNMSKKFYFIDISNESKNTNFSKSNKNLAFNKVLIHILNWFHGELDEYLIREERREKLSKLETTQKKRED